MNVLIFQHTPGENPGAFIEHISSHGDTARIVHLYEDQAIPALDQFDILLVLGGPMDVWETEDHPWLIPEKQAIKEWILDLKRPYFGICLGHQLLVDALGGRCAPMNSPEIGVLPVTMSSNTNDDPLFQTVKRQFPVLQWHGVEVVELPQGATVLAQSKACAIQIIRVFDKAWGVQFHPELVQGTIDSWMRDPANYQCAVDWLGSTEAVRDMTRESNQISSDQFSMTARIYQSLRQV